MYWMGGMGAWGIIATGTAIDSKKKIKKSNQKSTFFFIYLIQLSLGFAAIQVYKTDVYMH